MITTINVKRPCVAVAEDHSGNPMIHPIKNPRVTIYTLKIIFVIIDAKNLAITIIALEYGSAKRSFTVLSAYSLPKIQLVTNPNTKIPPTAIIWACKFKYDGQLASPAICALAPTNPELLASSGSLSINIKKPAIKGAIVKAAAVIQITLDLRILRPSACSAAKKYFITCFLLSHQ